MAAFSNNLSANFFSDATVATAQTAFSKSGNLFCALPSNVHFRIGEFLFPPARETLPYPNSQDLLPFHALQRTCKFLYAMYSPSVHPSLKSLITTLVESLEQKYRQIDSTLPLGYSPSGGRTYEERDVEAAQHIPAFIVSQGLSWLHAFVTEWKSQPRSRYWAGSAYGWMSYEEYQYKRDCESEQYSEAREILHEDPGRRERLITNWIWAELLKGIIKSFGSPEPWLCEKERLEFLRFLLVDWTPSRGDGVYESGDENDSDWDNQFNSDVTCEWCGGYRPLFERHKKWYGRYRKHDRRGEETGPVLSRDEVWFEDVMQLVVEVQHVALMKALVKYGGLEWRMWNECLIEKVQNSGRKPYKFKSKGFGLKELFRERVDDGYDIEFLKYLERERRIARLIIRVARALDTIESCRNVISTLGMGEKGYDSRVNLM
ncbi:hypothetical protein BJ508DRAFT_331779 [Ascobolus immersus RN42]|uniref:Uncharacterized protein n=1 Tax=Ascobolus immersus RN42 TaxID=1160509 RepID=A0A3N4HVA5_ASCIM|nr:hypothetical protein BJ508DRAFT_331779 [Ascobolus immersus RN42]